jgi:hypothetical protein
MCNPHERSAAKRSEAKRSEAKHAELATRGMLSWPL